MNQLKSNSLKTALLAIAFTTAAFAQRTGDGTNNGPAADSNKTWYIIAAAVVVVVVLVVVFRSKKDK